MKAVAVCALCIAACSSGSGAPEGGGRVPPIAGPIVFPDPHDLATGLGRDFRPSLDVRHSGLPVGASLETLSAYVSLKTWPELAPVPFSIAAHDLISTPGDIQDARIELVPSVSLEDRWYALVLDKLPPGFQLPFAKLTFSFGGAAYIARFRTSSGPFVVDARLCGDISRQTKVALVLSERVLASAGTIASAVTISQAGRPDVRCTVQANAEPAMWGALTNLCAGLFADTPVSISLAPSLASASGKPVLPFSANLLTSDLAFEEDNSFGSCFVSRPWSAASAVLPP